MQILGDKSGTALPTQAYHYYNAAATYFVPTPFTWRTLLRSCTALATQQKCIAGRFEFYPGEFLVSTRSNDGGSTSP
jgi:hypothetical protein